MPTSPQTFYSCSPHQPTPKRPPTLNAISPQTHISEARRERHLAVCQEIIELGMKLTRSAARRALEADEDEAQRRADAANTAPTRPEPAPPNPRASDPSLTFHRISRTVLHAVAIETEIANGTFRAPAFSASTSRALADDDQAEARLKDLCAAANRGVVADGLRRLAEHRPDRWALHDAIEDTVEESFADHPDDALPAHFARACQTLGLAPTLEGFPEDLIEALSPETAETWPTPDG